MSMRLCSPLTVIAALFVVGISLPVAALAQSQDASQQSASQSSSVADAARRNRDQKKNSAKSSKVITDDDLDRHVFKPGQAGFNVMAPPQLETEPPSAEAVAAAEAADIASDGDPTAQDSEIARLKLQIAQAEKD